MDNATNFSGETDAGGAELTSDTPVPADRRSTKRQILLIRVAKLISAQGEFVCVVRDFSEMGVSIRLFHAIPISKKLELEMPTGRRYLIDEVWRDGQEVGFAFAEEINSREFACEAGEYPKRPLRLGLQFPVRVNTKTQSSEAIVENLSKQGARLDGEMHFAIDQAVLIEALEGAVAFNDVRAKVRWRKETRCGVVFENTLSLEQFARLAARLQAPALLEDQ